jgi:hypothetical protein
MQPIGESTSPDYLELFYHPVTYIETMIELVRLRSEGTEINEVDASGVSVVVVAERFGVDRRYLRRALPEAGFRLRPPGRRKAQSSD